MTLMFQQKKILVNKALRPRSRVVLRILLMGIFSKLGNNHTTHYFANKNKIRTTAF